MPSFRDRLAAARAGWSSGRTPGPTPAMPRRRWRSAGPERLRRIRPAPLAPARPPGRWAWAREAVQTVFQGVTVLTAVAALLFTARSLDYTADATGATREQLRLSEQGQISDRFGKAVDQLGQEGTDKLSIRLGGIYALERVMRDSVDDEPTVIEVLCAFVRTHAPRPPWVSRARVQSPPDVQAAIVVLGRRPAPDADHNRRLDLSGTLLGLRSAALSHANLAGANLRGADLNKANLSRADLSQADLTWGLLIDADLTGADLSDVHLFLARMRDANMHQADLANADLRYVDLTGANLTGANLAGTDLTGVIGLTAGQLAGAFLDARTRLPDGLALPRPAR